MQERLTKKKKKLKSSEVEADQIQVLYMAHS